MKLKRTIPIIALMFVFIALVSCGKNTDVPAGMKLASDTTIVDYSLFVPESWVIDRHDGATMAHVSDTDRSSVTVAQWNITEDIKNFDMWWDDYKKQMNEALGEITVQTEAEKGALDGKAAQRYVYTAKRGETTYTFDLTVCAKGGSMYILTYTSIGNPSEENSLYSSNLDTVKKITENFRFN